MMTKNESPLGLLGLSMILSLAIHAGLIYLANHGFGRSTSTASPLPSPIKVEWVDLDQLTPAQKLVDVLDNKTVVQQTVASRYLSDQNRIASKQRLADPSYTENPQTQAQKNVSQESTHLNLSDQKISRILKQELPQHPTHVVSFNPNNYLPEIEGGEETMLSTQKFAYATYFNRMKRAIAVYWRPPASLIQHNPYKKTWVSTVLIVLDDQGNLNHQETIRSSGATRLDEFAMQAVAQAAPFYNPPEVLLDQAGEIRMNWSFIFEASRF